MRFVRFCRLTKVLWMTFVLESLAFNKESFLASAGSHSAPYASYIIWTKCSRHASSESEWVMILLSEFLSVAATVLRRVVKKKMLKYSNRRWRSAISRRMPNTYIALPHYARASTIESVKVWKESDFRPTSHFNRRQNIRQRTSSPHQPQPLFTHSWMNESCVCFDC